MEENKTQTIILDCPPGMVRPDWVIGRAIANTTLTVVESCSKFFGSWTFDYSHVPAKEWDAARDTILENLEKLLDNNVIRHGACGS